MVYALPDLAVTGQVIAAAWGNQNRDNWAESAVSKVTTAGDLVVGSGANALARLAAVAVGQVLKSNGVGAAPAYGQVATADIATAAVTPVKMANQRRAVVYKTGPQVIPNALVDTALTWEAEISDPDGWHSTSVNTSRITVAAAGLVVVRCSVQWGSTNASTTHRLRVRKNGTTVLAKVVNCHNIGGTVFFSTQHIGIEDVAAAGDYYEILAAHGGAGNCEVGLSDSGTGLDCIFSVVQQDGTG